MIHELDRNDSENLSFGLFEPILVPRGLKSLDEFYYSIGLININNKEVIWSDEGFKDILCNPLSNNSDVRKFEVP